MVANLRAYDEALLLPKMRLQIPESDIRDGSVEEITIPTSQGSYKRPWGQPGTFAVVYKFRTASGQFKALRCFRVEMQPDIHERYLEMSRYFRAHLPTITAGFHYYGDGILIDEHVHGKKQQVPHALIVMDWIEGETLLDKVNTLCIQRDQVGLGQLADQWLDLLSRMSHAHMAHGDLAASNIMVRGDGSLVLIDYDGCYIPPLSGKAPQVNGQPDYQHPQMKSRPFHRWMDSFSAYVIYVALRALQNQPLLWEKYAPRDGAGNLLEDRLLFSQKDFQEPDQSPLFREIEQESDPLLCGVTYLLKLACKQSVKQLLLPPLSKEMILSISRG